MGFWEKLRASIAKRNSLLCVGLDPVPEKIPSRYGSVAEFGHAIIAATAEVACCYKPNLAFYEALGTDGMAILADTLQAMPSDIPVILDGKRNDIANTADAYARSAYDVLGGDALTVNPYLGADGVRPFMQRAGKGVFILCKTSNPSAGELQDWSSQGVPLYAHVAELANQWAGDGEVGLVIGATYPEAIAEIRAQYPNSWFLIPGVGTQGGEVAPVLRAGLRDDGFGVLINASRAVLYADDPARAARELRDTINRESVSSVEQSSVDDQRVRIAQQSIDRLARGLFESHCVQFGDFMLHSGAHSPIYIDLRLLVSTPALLQEAAGHYDRLLKGLHYDRLAAIPYAALPIGTAVALQTGDPLIYPRRDAKGYGTQRQIEGTFKAGERVVLLDDLISSGESKIEAIQPLVAAGLVVEDIVVLIDRQQGGAEELAQKGLRLHTAVTLSELLASLERQQLVSGEEVARVHQFLASYRRAGAPQ